MKEVINAAHQPGLNSGLTFPGHDGPELAPHELAVRDQRLALLQGYFFDIANAGSYGEETKGYLKTGGSLRLSLAEIGLLSGECQQDQHLDAVRADYIAAAVHKPGLWHRKQKQAQLERIETAYADTVVAKIEAVVDAQTPKEALQLRQMPTLVENVTFASDRQLTEEDLAANHLYIVVDTALKEHTQRRQLIEQNQRKGRIAQVLGSRALRLSIAGGVFAASLAPDIGVLPSHGQHMTDAIEFGLRFLSGAIFSLSAPEAIRLKYLDFVHNRRTKELQDQLASSQRLSDLALRMTYNSTRYGSLDGPGRVTGRSGTADKQENLRRFARLDKEFPHLNNDPGGKPYTGEQALGYAARLLIERRGQETKIIEPGQTPAQQKQLYLALAREIIIEDVTRMRKGLMTSRLRRWCLNSLAMIPAVLFPSAVSLASDASGLSQDTVDALASSSQ